MKLNNIVDKFKTKKILILGDIMLDKYIWGAVSRISPEAPVQIVDVNKESYIPGGAANVAANIAELGAQALMVGVVGQDDMKDLLLKELKAKNIDTKGIITDEDKPTSLKVRVFGRNQQLLRFDYEKKGYVNGSTEDKILNFITKNIDDIDAIIISDYAKGVISESVMKQLTQLCKDRNKKIIVDPKPSHKDFYTNVTLLTPNHKEAHEMTGFSEKQNIREDIESMGQHLKKYLNSNILITRGEKGMSLFETNEDTKFIPTFAKEVYDIVGAGDTVVAALGLALAADATFEEAAIIANHAAGITVGKVGTSTVTVEELKKSIESSEK